MSENDFLPILFGGGITIGGVVLTGLISLHVLERRLVRETQIATRRKWCDDFAAAFAGFLASAEASFWSGGTPVRSRRRANEPG